MQPKESAGDRKTFSEWMRIWFKWILDPTAGFLNRIGLYPNTVTLIGLAGNFVASYFLARGNFLVGGLLVLAMGPVDALDGAMARLRGEPTDFGSFVDSVSDRYSELMILGGLLIYYLRGSNLLMAGMVFVAASGSVLVSYVRAKAESLGYECRRGIFTRLERYLVIIPSLVLGYPHIGIVVIAVFANATALQRIALVRRQARPK